MTPCQHLRCPSPADGWAHLDCWRRFCADHLAIAARSGATLAGADYAPESEPPPEPRARQMEPDVPAASPAPVLPPLPRVRALPAPKVAPRPHAPQDAPQRPQPPKRRHGAPSLLLPLREGRCRCCERPAKAKRRGMCLNCYRWAFAAGVLDEVAAPRRDREALPPPVLRPDQEPGRCRCCDRRSVRHLRDLCHGCYRRARRDGVLDAVARPVLGQGQSITQHDRINEVNHA